METVRVAEGDNFVCFGTEGLTGGMPRLSTVTCLDDCELLHFATFRVRLSEAGVEALARRAFASFVESELKEMPLFFGLKGAALFEVACMFELRECASAGTVLFSPGMPAAEIYILAKGRVVLVDTDGVQLVKLQAGSVDDGYPFFGERSLLEGGARTSSAVTRTPCKLLVLQRCHFARILKLMPSLRARLQEFYELRLSRAHLARQAAADEKQREHVERRARLLGGTTTEDAALDPIAARHEAAVVVQAHWRGARERSTDESMGDKMSERRDPDPEGEASPGPAVA